MIGDEAEMDTRVSLLIRLRREPADQRAWDEFAQRYGGLISAWCRQWGLQPADADDVSQNVLLKLAHHLRIFVYDPGRRFRGFLRTMAHNACMDYLDNIRRSVTASGDSGVYAVLESIQARDDLATRLEAAFDLERLEVAQARVRQRDRAAHLGGLSPDGAGGPLRRRGGRPPPDASRHGLQGQEQGAADAPRGARATGK